MRRPEHIPPSLPAEAISGWTDQRIGYIQHFQMHNWYPNNCVQALIDLEAADALRKRLNAEDSSPGRRITLSHVLIKATANALRNHILFNSKHNLRDAFLVYPDIHVANVVDTEGMASRVIIEHADRLGLRQLAEISHRLVSARRATMRHKLDRFEKMRRFSRVVAGLAWFLPALERLWRDNSQQKAIDFLERVEGTVIVTNPGTLGVQDCKAMMFFGHMMTCIRVMAIEEEARMVDGRLVFRRILPVGLDYDQRLCDAGAAARFLNEIRRNLEQPERYTQGPAQIAPDQEGR